MVTVGIDPHKSTLTAVAVTEVGRTLTQITVPNQDEGFLRLRRWCTRFDTLPRFAVEDGRGMARRLVTALLTAGAQVVWVPTKLMAQTRASARTRGKSDPIDALAVARAALREPELPVAHLDEPARDLRLLCDRRDNLVAARTRAINQLRWHLTDLDPDLEPPLRTLNTHRTQTRLDTALRARPASVQRDLALDLLADITHLTNQITTLEQRITDIVTPLAPALLAITGVGPITAATILGHVAGITRFRSPAAFAMHTGTAPIPICSGKTVYRLNRGGNRTLNSCLHRIAITQLAHHTPAHNFIHHHHRQQRPNTTPKTALRALKRHLNNTIYHALNTDQHRPTPTNTSHLT
jgi:transposase